MICYGSTWELVEKKISSRQLVVDLFPTVLFYFKSYPIIALPLAGPSVLCLPCAFGRLQINTEKTQSTIHELPDSIDSNEESPEFVQHLNNWTKYFFTISTPYHDEIRRITPHSNVTLRERRRIRTAKDQSW